MPINNQEKLTKVNSKQFIDMMNTALYWLKEQKSFIDSLNVFPVPDGDTGTNMYLTFKEAVSSLKGKETANVSQLAAALSKGALMGARGNSGVILSQLIRGLSQALKGREDLDSRSLAEALKKASEVAYHGVLKPVEGTILTVSREAAAEAEKKAKSGQGVGELLEIVIKEAKASLKRTPDLLAALKEAEVVDAGGQGYVTILEGMLKGLRGEEITSAEVEAEKNTQKKSEPAADIKFTYCTQLLIEIDSRINDLDTVINKTRKDLQDYGDSIMVVGSDEIIKIHVHTNHPGVVLEYGLKKGKVFDIKIDNMRKQNQEKVRRENDEFFDHSQFHPNQAAHDSAESQQDNDSIAKTSDSDQESVSKQAKITVEKNTGIISVANGEGIINILHELGVDYVIEGGQSMNPSTNDFLEAVKKLSSNQIIILPNNKNIISAAKQVAELTDKAVAIVETKSIPQAITAMMAYNDDLKPVELKDEMEAELTYVKTLEITRAVKDSKVNGMQIKQDNFIGLCEGKIVVTATNEIETIQQLLQQTAADEELVTIYYGEDVTAEQAAEIKEIITAEYDFDEVELYSGGQPLYPFIISLE
ncbi:DAK2 domain-containing protein [Halanaerobium salsuginis]|uniref:DhaL domain-containing protein n=1 Tax=Halanaerobium salsuginis TaxID=29563 RepID=A0A1I4EIU4_9FIRM|nr:DAK2 domain-containing protein [Halanaerobium salsuginis]SFL05654.1 hypothetical protein SAMN02983006_00003 [Halanaerobium salsuginis]